MGADKPPGDPGLAASCLSGPQFIHLFYRYKMFSAPGFDCQPRSPPPPRPARQELLAWNLTAMVHPGGSPAAPGPRGA